MFFFSICVRGGCRGAVAVLLLDFRLSNAQTSLSAAFGSGSIGGPLVNCARPSERENRRVRRRFCTATTRPRLAGETPKKFKIIREGRSFDAFGVCGCGSVMSARKRPAATLALHTTRGGIRCPLRGGSRCGPLRGWSRWWGRSRGSAT